MKNRYNIPTAEVSLTIDDYSNLKNYISELEKENEELKIENKSVSSKNILKIIYRHSDAVMKFIKSKNIIYQTKDDLVKSINEFKHEMESEILLKNKYELDVTDTESITKEIIKKYLHEIINDALYVEKTKLEADQQKLYKNLKSIDKKLEILKTEKLNYKESIETDLKIEYENKKKELDEYAKTLYENTLSDLNSKYSEEIQSVKSENMRLKSELEKSYTERITELELYKNVTKVIYVNPLIEFFKLIKSVLQFKK